MIDLTTSIKQYWCVFRFGFLLFITVPVSAQIDVALQLTANQEIVNIGEPITFTITAVNVLNTSVSNLSIQFNIPNTVDYESHNAPLGTSYNSATGVWNINNQLTGGTPNLSLEITFSPNEEGTHFIVGEVATVDEVDYNSIPQNGDFREDDIVLGWLTVPILFYQNIDSIELVAPPISGGHQWTRNKNGFIQIISTDSIFTTSLEGTYTYFNPQFACGIEACFSVVLTAIQTCQSNIISINCDDNGTISDGNDDFFDFTIEINPSNTGNGNQYFISYNNTILNLSGTNYDTPITISHPDFIANGLTEFIFSIVDNDDAACNEIITITAPPNCSNYSDCNFYSTVIEDNCCTSCENGNIFVKTVHWKEDYINLINANLALNKPVIFNGTPGVNNNSNAYLSIDGKFEGESNTNFDYAFSTAGNFNRWDIDLVGKYDLNEIRIFTKTSWIGGATNYLIFISENPFNTTDHQQLLLEPNVQSFSIPINVIGNPSILNNLNLTGRFVRVYLEGSGQMQLVEVEIIGDGRFDSSPYHYNWSDPNIGNTPNPSCLSSGNYQVAITDVLTGCVSTVTIEVD